MQVERAKLSDALSVMQIVTLCIAQMRAQGIYQWDEIYPNLHVVEEGARSGALFVIRQEGGCVASVCLNDVQPEQYHPLPWRCPKGRALVIHRLCVHPEWQRRGAGRHLMDFTEKFAQEQGFSCIRLDCYTGNPRALALYERRGYQRIGQALFPRRELPFDCFEKIMA
jgi:ribosomal protein S18 acetylase RimI-like enzyme